MRAHSSGPRAVRPTARSTCRWYHHRRCNVFANFSADAPWVHSARSTPAHAAGCSHSPMPVISFGFAIPNLWWTREDWPVLGTSEPKGVALGDASQGNEWHGGHLEPNRPGTP